MSSLLYVRMGQTGVILSDPADNLTGWNEIFFLKGENRGNETGGSVDGLKFVARFNSPIRQKEYYGNIPREYLPFEN